MEVVSYGAYGPEAEKLLSGQTDSFVHLSGLLLSPSAREITTSLVAFVLSLFNKTQ
jgi:hypothetical protein